MEKSKHRVQSVVHLFLGSTLVIKGFDKFSHHPVVGGIMLSFGLVVLGYFVYLVIKKEQSHTMHILVHFFEALVSLLMAWVFFEEDKKYLQYFYLLASLGFLISAILSLSRKGHGRG